MVVLSEWEVRQILNLLWEIKNGAEFDDIEAELLDIEEMLLALCKLKLERDE